MGMDGIIVSLILATPLVGAAVILLLPERGKLAAWAALFVSLLTFLLTLHLPAHFVPGQSGFQFEETAPWLANPLIRYHVGVDGLSLWLVVLVGLLAPVGVVASWHSVRERSKVFYALFLVQQTAMVGVFVSLDLMLYYGFWELSLIPMAILIAMYGRNQTEGGGAHAALRFFLYTFISSAPLLVALLWLYARVGSFDYAVLRGAIATGALPAGPLCWVSLAFLVAFAVKVPVLGAHGWLADTFAEAPVAMGMVVAGKLGLYSLIRFHVGLFPVEAREAAPWMIGLAAIGILYGALLALVQKDFWRLLAYGTLSSLSFCTLGIYGFTLTGLDGALLQTVNEGIVGGALFVMLGFLYERYGTSQIGQYGGVARKAPVLATLFVMTGLALAGLPLLNGFVGEFLVLSSTFTGVNKGWAVAATAGVILSAAYVLQLVQKVFLGEQSAMVAGQLSPPVSQQGFPSGARDLRGGEKLVLVALVALMVALGVAPNTWLEAMEPGLKAAASVANPLKTPAASPAMKAGANGMGGKR